MSNQETSLNDLYQEAAVIQRRIQALERELHNPAAFLPIDVAMLMLMHKQALANTLVVVQERILMSHIPR